MSNRSKWPMAWVWLLVCAFAFGYGYGVAYEEAWASEVCGCIRVCPPDGYAMGTWNTLTQTCEPCNPNKPCCLCVYP